MESTNPFFHISGNPYNLKKCERDLGTFPRIFLATVPRSGNGLARKALTSPSRIETCGVFPIGGTIWDERAGCYFPEFLIEDRRLPEGGDYTVIKTHYPFFIQQTVDDECISAVFKSVRHVLTNYLAWSDYLLHVHLEKDKKAKVPADRETAIIELMRHSNWTLTRYAARWSEHHTYWREYAASNGVPLVEWLYEDICSDSAPFSKAFVDLLKYDVVHQENLDVALGKDPEECWVGRLRSTSVFQSLVSREEALEVFSKYGEQLRSYGYSDKIWDEVL